MAVDLEVHVPSEIVLQQTRQEVICLLRVRDRLLSGNTERLGCLPCLAGNDRPPLPVADGMELGVQPAFGAPDTSGKSPPFNRLAAVRCA